MAQELQECEAHGTPTRLRCAEEGCGKPICPQCLVKTPVGLKCEEHAQAVAPRFDRRAAPLALLALLLVAAAVVILAVAVLNQGDSPTRAADDTPAPGASGTAGDQKRIVPASVYVVNADGTQPHTLTNRPLAFDASPVWSPDGSRIAFESTIEGKRAIWVMRADGENLRRLTDGGPGAGSDGSPTWSPDGTQIAFMSDRDGNAELYTVNLDGQQLRRLTDNPATDSYPAWSPDGARLAFLSDRDGGETAIWALRTDGPPPAQDQDQGPTLLVPGPVAPGRPAWSPEGRNIAFSSDRGGADLDIWVASLPSAEPNPPPTRLITSPGQDGEPAFSPDGSRVAFASDRDGAPEVYVAARDGSNPTKLTSTPRSFAPDWAPDGTKLAYIHDPIPTG